MSASASTRQVSTRSRSVPVGASGRSTPSSRHSRPRPAKLPMSYAIGGIVAASASSSATERSVTLRSNDTKAPAAFKVTKVESSLPIVTAEAKATENPGEYQVLVKLAKDAKEGALDGTLKIYTSDTATPVFTLPVRGTVKVAAAGTGSSK